MHYTVDPSFNMTTAAAKGLHALMYKLQEKVKKAGLSPAEFHRDNPGTLKIEMPSAEFVRLIHAKSTNVDHIRRVIKDLGNLKADLDRVDESGKLRIRFLNLFISADYDEARVIFEIPEQTTRMLVSEKTAAVIDLLTVAEKFKCKYSIFLNDLLEERAYQTGTEDFILELDDEQLRNAMKIPFKEVGKKKVYTYKEPSNLKRKVLDVAIEELNTAGLRFEVVFYKHEKRFGTIYWVFDVRSRQSLLNQEIMNKFSHEINAIHKALKDMHLSDSALSEILQGLSSEKDVAYVEYNIEQTRSRKAKKSQAGLFMTCMVNNHDAFDSIWADKKRERDLEAKRRKQEYQDELNRQRTAHTEEFIGHKLQSKMTELKSNKDLCNELIPQFLEHLETIPFTSAKKIKEQVILIGINKDIFEDRIFINFIEGLVKQSVDQDELDKYVQGKGTVLIMD